MDSHRLLVVVPPIVETEGPVQQQGLQSHKSERQQPQQVQLY
jgi:hypothetical protein